MVGLDSLERILWCPFWWILLILRVSLAWAFNSPVGFPFQTLHKIAPRSKSSGTLRLKWDSMVPVDSQTFAFLSSVSEQQDVILARTWEFESLQCVCLGKALTPTTKRTLLPRLQGDRVRECRAVSIPTIGFLCMVFIIAIIAPPLSYTETQVKQDGPLPALLLNLRQTLRSHGKGEVHTAENSVPVEFTELTTLNSDVIARLCTGQRSKPRTIV